jgi:hypothetical protein
MRTLDERELRAILALRSNDDFMIFVKMMSARAEEYNKRLIYSKDADNLLVLQGLTRAYVEVLESVDGAPAAFDKLTQGSD